MMTNTDALLDHVLDCMIPDLEMTLVSVHESFTRSTMYKVTPAEILACLERLNYLHEEGREVEITVENAAEQRHLYRRPLVPGMGATYSIGSDRYACTIVAVSASKNRIVVRCDKAIRTDGNGMSESQSYRYERDPAGRETTWYRDSAGRYGNKRRGGRLTPGVRAAYHDYSF
jgi:hypothetical protein